MADASEELLAPGKLIDKYTSWANLDEAALGKYLMKLAARRQPRFHMYVISVIEALDDGDRDDVAVGFFESRSEEHTSELQSLMRLSYAVFCLTKKRCTHSAMNEKF